MTRVLLAVDGSDFSRHAVERALGLVRSDAALTLVTVVLPLLPASALAGVGVDVEPVTPVPLGEDALATRRREAEVELEETARTLGLGSAETTVLTGDPGPILCQLANSGDYDLVVVGSHGSGFLKRVLVGSVSHHLLHHAPCPVLVVAHPQTKDE